MRKFTTYLNRTALFVILFLFAGTNFVKAQTYSMQITNCAATSNRIEFDVFITNAGPATMQVNSVVVRLTHSAAILPATGNAVTIGFVNDGLSNLPLLWPPNASPAFVYTASTRQFSVSTSTSIYLNGTLCSAPNIAVGATIKVGRFYIQNAVNWVGGQSAGLTWVASGASIVYLNCSSVTSSAASLVKTLTTPCTLTTPSGSCALVASISGSTNPLCNGGATGSATVSTTGATGAVSYLWSNGQTTATATGLSATTYTVTATDAGAANCTSSASVTITQPTVVSAVASSSPVINCHGGQTTVTLVGSGGVGPYTYSFNGGAFQSSGIYSGVTAGTKNYSVKDANNCNFSSSITITEPPTLVASVVQNAPIACNGGTTTVTVSAVGGTPAYTGTGTFTASAGLNSYTVTDANGCTAPALITLSQPSAVVASSSVTTAIACNGGSATVAVSATGGTAPYTGTGSFSQAAGSHTYTVTDANGCTATTTITVTQPSAVVASSTQGAAIACNGGSTTVTVSATGGTGTYTGTGLFSGQLAGPHTYTVTDANGCSTTTSITITQPSAITASSSVTTAIACNGGSATVAVSATGGTAPYTGTGSLTGQLAGPHTYTVTDANGCSTTTTITVTQPTAVSASSSVTTAIACFGGSATVAVSATGGTAPYTGTGSFSQAAGSHTYTVSDANGCSTSTSVTVSQPTAVVASSVQGDAIACNGGSTTVTVSATGGTGSYTGTGTFTVGAGTYNYNVSDANGCSTSTSITVTQPSQVSVSASAGTIACFGGSATVTVSATGGTGSYTGAGTFSQFAGTMSYTVTDANGCSASTTVTLTQPTKVEGATSTTPSGCTGATGTASVTGTGGTGTYSYLWSNGQATATATGLAVGTYTVTLTDGNGCTGTATATVGGTGGAPGTPGSIVGPVSVCRSTSGIVYSVPAVSGAASYNWSLPTGVTGSSTSNSITVAVSSTYVGGFICVSATNACGTGSQSCMNLPVITTYASQPTAITGSSVACGPAVYTYSTTATNALSFTWTVTGTGVSIVSGQGTNSIQVSVPAGFTQGSVQVYSSNCYGNSAVRGMTITGTPSHSNAVSGPSFVCANNTAVYTMPLVNGVAASNYVWSVTGGATVVSSSVGTLASATIAFGPTWTSGTITISVSNTCGSYARTFAVRSTPAQPGSITGPGTALCGLSNVTYSIAAVAGATSYSWTVPAGVSIVSTAPNGLSVTVNFTPAFTSNSADICVTANNSCGASASRCYTVTSRPAAPVITGPTSVCKSQTGVAYSLAPVSGATSYAWSISGGASIAPSGTSATVNYNTSLSTTATLRANAINACGASQPAALNVAVNLFCRTAADASTVSTSELGAYPNPTSGKATVSFNATEKSKYIVKVTDMIGNTLVSNVVNVIEGYNTQEIDLTGVAKGLYMISVTAENGTTETLRLVVE